MNNESRYSRLQELFFFTRKKSLLSLLIIEKSWNPLFHKLGLCAVFGVMIMLSTACGGHATDEDSHDDHDEIHEHGIELGEELRKEFGIEEETVSIGKFNHVIKVGGKIEASSSDIHTVIAKQSGIITLSPHISLGVSVKSGQTIGNITVEGIQGGDVNRAAQSNLAAAQAEYERLKPLHEAGLVTTSAFREAERAYKEAQALAGKSTAGGSVLTAPAAGNIQALYVTTGEYVEVGSPVAVISKNSNLTLKADLPVREASHLAELETANFIPEGSDEVVRLSELNGRLLNGNVAGAVNGYIPVYFTFTGNPLSFPGGYAEIYLICGERSEVISVPREALIEIQGNKYAYVADEDGHGFEKRLIRPGASDGERIEILEGLEPGERIVSKGASVVRMAELSSIAPPSHSHNH